MADGAETSDVEETLVFTVRAGSGSVLREGVHDGGSGVGVSAVDEI